MIDNPKPGSINHAIRAYETHRAEAESAFALYVDHCEGLAPPRVPGMSTVVRLAARIAMGRTIEEAAAREYVYRWNLAILPPDQCIGHSVLNPCCSIFGTPHAFGL